MRPGLVDPRLAGFAVSVWSASLYGLHASARTGALVALAAAVLAAVLGRRLTSPHRYRCGPPAGTEARAVRCGWVVLAAALGVFCGATSTAARVSLRDAQPVHGLAAQRAVVRVEVTVAGDPRPVRGSGSYAVPASLRSVRTTDGVVRVAVRVLVLAADPGWRPLLPGTPVSTDGRLIPARGGDLRAAVLVAAGPPVAGAAPWSQRAAGALRAGLRRACERLPAGPRGLLPGLVDGDTSGLDPAVAEEFRATGMTHLVAVSGANLAITGGVVLALARWCRAGPRLCALVCGLAMVGFVILARPTPSVVRAAAMAALGLLALALGRSQSAVPGLAAAVVVLVLADPELAGDAGFALSVFATGGLLLVAPGWRDALRTRAVPAGLAEALAVPAAAQLACAPVIAGLSGTVSLVAVPANLLAEPAVAPATILGVLSALLSVASPAAAAFVAWLGSFPARWLLIVAGRGAGVPVGVLPWPAGVAGALLLAVLLALALVVGRRPAARRIGVVCALAAVFGAVSVVLLAPGWPPGRQIVVVCDVGQGDTVVLPLAAGEAVVVDAGPEPVATDRCLRSLGVRVVSLLVISHFHADHVGGVDGVYRGRRVAAIVACPYQEPAAGRDALDAAAAAHGTPVSVPPAGWTWRAGPLRLALLGPVRMLAGTDSDPNNNSLVLVADVAGHRILLAADAERDEQADVLASVGAAALRVDVLKVAHHGSEKQDTALLDAVRPAVALVPVGVDNGYGLPNMPVLRRLARSGAIVARTDLDGDLAVTADRYGLHLLRHGVPPGRRRQ